MPVYQFTATDQNGTTQQGTFEAADEQQAYSQLSQYGLTATQVVPVEQTSPSAAVASHTPDPVKAAKSSTDVSAKATKPTKPKEKRRKEEFFQWNWAGAQIQKIFLFLPDKCLPLFMLAYPC